MSHNINKQFDDDDDRQDAAGYKIPDRDYYRKNFCPMGSVHNYLHNRLYIRSFRERHWDQPHYSSLLNVQTPYANIFNPSDGICCHFLRRAFTKPIKYPFTCALWSADSRVLVLGTSIGDLALWEAESLKVLKVISIIQHKTIKGGKIAATDQHQITAMALKHYGNLLVTGDDKGIIQICDEAFKNVTYTNDGHRGSVRGLSYSPFDSKFVSCGEDKVIKIWSGRLDRPEKEIPEAHTADIKCIDWHPYRSLIASGSGSREDVIKLWDPKVGSSVSTICSHKMAVNSIQWNQNGNWLASASTDGMVKVYDIRVMKEIESIKGHNTTVCKLAWHPIHESLIVSGGYDGSIVYSIVGQEQLPHSVIVDAHKQSISLLSWHPSGHLLASASYDSILKFWSREPPGSTLEPQPNEIQQENPPTLYAGPLPANKALAATKSSTLNSTQAAAFAAQAQQRASNDYNQNNPQMNRKRQREQN